MRVSKITSELNISVELLGEVLRTLGFKELEPLFPTANIPEEIVNAVRQYYLYENTDLFNILEFRLNSVHSEFKVPINSDSMVAEDSCNDCCKIQFCLKEIYYKSHSGLSSRILVDNFIQSDMAPFYSVIIGSNGVGKSSILKEIIEFFIDLHSYVDSKDSRLKKRSVSKESILGVKYIIDGSFCEVIRLERNFLVKINGKPSIPGSLPLPSLVACNFGIFDKLPVQSVGTAISSRYNVSYYKYVGAHVNGSLISSSAISFRLLFTLCEHMTESQISNVCSVLDFIGYNHVVSLRYSLIKKSRKSGVVKNEINKLVLNDKTYKDYDSVKKCSLADALYKFYNEKVLSSKDVFLFNVDFDTQSTFAKSEELQLIYKLKQYEYVKSISVVFYKGGQEIASEDMSSGEFSMLATVLSLSVATPNSHTLVLLDEPELNQHPNWQMSLISNLDKALKNRNCHLLIATHSHLLVSDLPLNRSSVVQLERGSSGEVISTPIPYSTYGWSAEEVLLKVFRTATDRNRYFAERIGSLLEKIGDGSITPIEIESEIEELQNISKYLSDVDPMKSVLMTLIEAYGK